MRILLLGLLLGCLLWSGCRSAGDAKSPVAERAPASVDQRADVTTQGGEHAPSHAIHNVVHLTGKILSGSVPEGPAGFQELRAMGVRTILSVDGAAPEVELARREGLRYVHLPIGYNGMAPQRGLEIARALRDLNGPVYVHCHHGRHRGPAAAATAAVLLGDLTPEQGLAILKQAGTSPDYKGLFACVSEARPASREQLDTAISEFPEIAPTPRFVQAMVEIQDVCDRLAAIRDARWATPQDHPDLIPAAEAGRLENLLRALLIDPEVAEHPADFAQKLRESHEAARAFEDALSAPLEEAALTSLLREVNASCKDCHASYRDVR